MTFVWREIGGKTILGGDEVEFSESENIRTSYSQILLFDANMSSLSKEDPDYYSD